ncbi:hypothetical protein KIPB_004372 [Kipferlia bialata]|uniref:Uncharacterized protein n=1 Tax=Kipferlia bialata TaxID=797122 RepID=A0A391NNI3_9EUKA|nr:hypothetical protein KIPB_004372 [Kipferlia bialata]|eukprot:g4372.t1
MQEGGCDDPILLTSPYSRHAAALGGLSHNAETPIPIPSVTALSTLCQVSAELYPDRPLFSASTSTQEEYLSVVITAAAHTPLYMPFWRAICRCLVSRVTEAFPITLDLSLLRLDTRPPGQTMGILLPLLRSVSFSEYLAGRGLHIVHHPSVPTPLADVLMAAIVAHPVVTRVRRAMLYNQADGPEERYPIVHGVSISPYRITLSVPGRNESR